MASIVIASLSNEIRLKTLVCLASGEKNVTELISNCHLSQSAVSQHLEKLRKAGLVTTRKEGKEIYYSLKYLKSAKVARQIIDFAREVEK